MVAKVSSEQTVGYRWMCGGSLISDQDVLTAVHCVTDEIPDTKQTVVANVSLISVYLGLNNRDRKTGALKPIRVATAISLDGSKGILESDIAVLSLGERVTLNSTIQSVCLPRDISNHYDGWTAVVSGWGDSDSIGHRKQPAHLQATNVRVMPFEDCINNRQYAGTTLTASHLCATLASTGFCDGDSGGPLTVKENGSFVQIGVVSFGVAQCPDDPKEGAPYPQVFARVTTTLNWIHRQLIGAISPRKTDGIKFETE